MFSAFDTFQKPNCSFCICQPSQKKGNCSFSASLVKHSNNKVFESCDKTKNGLKEARYSKSLDQLQFSTKNRFYSSLYNVADYTENIRSLLSMKDHNEIKYNQSFDKDKIKCTNYDDLSDKCDCYKYKTSYAEKTCNINTNFSSIGLNNIAFNNSNCIDEKYKHFVKNFTNVKQKCQKLVKSLSHTPSDSTQHIFRSNSMQITPKMDLEKNCEVEETENSLSEICNSERQMNNETLAVSPSLVNIDHFREENNSDISEEHTPLFKKDKIFMNDSVVLNIISLRKVRSAGCLGAFVSSVVLSGTESLPNIGTYLEEDIQSIGMTNYSSSSSCTSERSGWITSRSSSESSSETNRLSINNGIIQNLFDFEKKLQISTSDKFANNSHKKYQKKSNFLNGKGK